MDPQHSPRVDETVGLPSGSESPTVIRFGILVKILGITAIALGGAVAGLTAYSSTKQLNKEVASLERRSAVYARLVAEQAKSAVAFQDKETAREILRSITVDSSVTGIAIYTEHGLLEEEGKLSRTAQAVAHRLDANRVFSLPDSYLSVALIQSLEGPRGTVVFELSKSELKSARKSVIVASLLGGLLALAVALGLSWPLSKALARRIKVIASAASSVANGDLTVEPISDRSQDEVGVLARGFNTMVDHLRSLLAQMEKRAQDEKERLELLVQERTSALDARNEELRLVMDNVDQGFLSLDSLGRMSSERSARVEQWFGAVKDGEDFFCYLERAGRIDLGGFRLAWDQLVEDILPEDVCLGQIPGRVVIQGRTFQLDLRPIRDALGRFSRALVVMSDVTPLIERERAEQEERETVVLVSRLLRDRHGVLGFFAETERLVHEIHESSHDGVALRRHVHTLKGNAGIFGLASIVTACHQVEDELSVDDEIDPASIERLVATVRHVTDRFSIFLKEKDGGVVVEREDQARLLKAIERGARHDELAAMVRDWENEPLRTRMERVAAQLETLARRLGKGPVEIDIQCDALRQPEERWQPLWSELSHVIRNAVDHGLETPEERKRNGKSEAAKVVLKGFQEGSHLTIEIEDSGRGIDWLAVEQKALRLGLIRKTGNDPDTLSELLFADGLSTKETVSELSGRGVGLAALKRTVQAHGGDVKVRSRLGHGTRFAITWPIAPNKAANDLLASAS